MIFNQKEFELAKSLETITYLDPEIHEKVMRIIRNQGFAKSVFLGYSIIDDWEGIPCIFMERAP